MIRGGGREGNGNEMNTGDWFNIGMHDNERGEAVE